MHLLIKDSDLPKNGVGLKGFAFTLEMLFCYQNCFDLLREKIVLVIKKTFEFAKILRSLEQFIQTVKGQNNFW